MKINLLFMIGGFIIAGCHAAQNENPFSQTPARGLPLGTSGTDNLTSKTAALDLSNSLDTGTSINLVNMPHTSRETITTTKKSSEEELPDNDDTHEEDDEQEDERDEESEEEDEED